MHRYYMFFWIANDCGNMCQYNIENKHVHKESYWSTKEICPSSAFKLHKS